MTASPRVDASPTQHRFRLGRQDQTARGAQFNEERRRKTGGVLMVARRLRGCENYSAASAAFFSPSRFTARSIILNASIGSPQRLISTHLPLSKSL